MGMNMEETVINIEDIKDEVDLTLEIDVKKTVQRMRAIRWMTWMAAIMVFVILIGLSVLMAIFVPQMAIFIPILAVGMALALQKYTASFAAYFVIIFSRIYDIGDRIRIGGIKGDVRSIGWLHSTLEEVGEDEKLGGELTGRLLHVPNLIILDSPVLNYTKDYTANYKTISSDYMFDEVRIPITTISNVERAVALLETILKEQDEVHIKGAEKTFLNGYPKFLDEALNGPRVIIHIEPQRIWIKGKFVTPVKGRNELRSTIIMQFIKEIRDSKSDIKLA
jgi:small-conductance mechanosensitive channel